jgi:two-component system sensor histidine kinase RpfC
MKAGWGGVPLEAGLRNERGQAYVRLGICVFMAAYFYAIGFSNHQLYLWFVFYCLAYLALLRRARGFSTIRTLLALFLDNYFTIGGLHVTGEQGVFLYIFLIHITFGYGVRYGRRYLWLSVLVACAGVISLYVGAPSWRGNVHSFIAFFVGVPFIALYINYFVTHLRRAQLISEAHAAELERLIAFVAHDIRTPLQSLLTTIELARDSSVEPGTRKRLSRIEQAVRLLGRMTTELLQRRDHPASKKPHDDGVIVYPWIMGLMGIFADDITRSRIGLRYDFDLNISPFLAFDRHAGERLLLNAFSNAVRFSADGTLIVSVSSVRHAKPTRLTVSVSNRGGAAARRESGDDMFHGAGLGLVASQAIAESIGGSFWFVENSNNEHHHCHIELPCTEANSVDGGGMALPALAIGLSEIERERLRSSLDGHASLLSLDSLVDASGLAERVRQDAGALFIDSHELARAATDANFKALLEKIGPYVGVGTAEASHLQSDTGPLLVLTNCAVKNANLNALYAVNAAREIEVESMRTQRFGGLAGRHLLLVEDNFANAEVLKEALASVLLRVTHAPSLDSARALLKLETFDLVVLDWYVGTATAATLLAEARSAASGHRARWIVLSSESTSEILRHLPGDLDCQILQRPVTIETLVAALEVANSCAAVGIRPQNASRKWMQPIVDFGLYEEMRLAGTPALRVRALLCGFVNEMNRALNDLDNVLREGDDAFRALHAIKSVGEAAGALEMGRAALAVLTRFGEGGRTAIRADMGLIVEAWHLTKRHIGLYEVCLDVLGAAEPSGAGADLSAP